MGNMVNKMNAKKRRSLEEAEKLLSNFLNLSDCLGDQWLSREYKKPIGEWSLITGWLSTKDPMYMPWLPDLDHALGIIKQSVSKNTWQTLSKKIRSHSDRANTKGILSEIAIIHFLVSNSVKVEINQKINASSEKDVDIMAVIEEFDPIYIEVQWISPSDLSDRGSLVASSYGEAYPMDYDYEKRRIKGKLIDKLPKFSEELITFVAMDCTSSPELGGKFLVSPTGSASNELFQHLPEKKEEQEQNLSPNKLLTGVIWFELEPGFQLLPKKRSYLINPNHKLNKTPTIEEFKKLWLG